MQTNQPDAKSVCQKSELKHSIHEDAMGIGLRGPCFCGGKGDTHLLDLGCSDLRMSLGPLPWRKSPPGAAGGTQDAHCSFICTTKHKITRDTLPRLESSWVLLGWGLGAGGGWCGFGVGVGGVGVEETEACC